MRQRFHLAGIRWTRWTFWVESIDRLLTGNLCENPMRKEFRPDFNGLSPRLPSVVEMASLVFDPTLSYPIVLRRVILAVGTEEITSRASWNHK